MAKLYNSWWNAFGGAFDTEEDVIEFIFERMYTSDFEDSYIDCVGYREPNELVKQTASEKKEFFYDFMMSLLN